MLLLDGEDGLHHAARRRVVVAEPFDDLVVRLDRDALGDEILLHHLEQIARRVVLAVAARGEPFRVEVGLALQLRDPQRDLIGVLLLLGGVLEELGGHGRGVEPLRRVVVALVAEHAHELGGQRLVEHVDHPLAVGAIGLRDRTLLDRRSRTCPQGLHVGQELLRHGGVLSIDRVSFGAAILPRPCRARATPQRS